MYIIEFTLLPNSFVPPRDKCMSCPVYLQYKVFILYSDIQVKWWLWRIPIYGAFYYYLKLIKSGFCSLNIEISMGPSVDSWGSWWYLYFSKFQSLDDKISWLFHHSHNRIKLRVEMGVKDILTLLSNNRVRIIFF